MRRTGWLWALALLLPACSDDGPSGMVREVAQLRLSPAQLTVIVGDTAEVNAAALAADGSQVEGVVVEWSVSGSDVASIIGAGRHVRVLGRRGGLVTLRAEVEEVSGEVLVEVSNPVPQISALAPVGVPAGTPDLQLTVLGSRFMPGAQVLWNGAPRPTTYLSETRLEAQIPAADLGDVTAAEVRVQNPLPGGGTSPERQLFHVQPRPVAGITLQPAALALAAGDTARLTARVRDSNGAELPGRPVTWSTSNAAVAQVDASGLVSALGVGAAVVSAVSEGVSASVPVTVTSPALPRITGITPDSAPVGRIEITVRGENFAPNAVAFALGRTQPTERLSAQELRVLLWDEDSRVAQSFELKVMNPVGRWSNPVTFTITHVLAGVRITAAGQTDLFPGELSQLTAVPLDERNQPLPGNFPVQWRSSNAAVASVGAAGLVTAHSPGQVYVEAEIAGRRGGATIDVLPPIMQWDLLFEGSVNGVPELLLARLDGSGTLTRLLPGVRASDPAVTLDGSRIAFVATDQAGNRDIYVVNRDGSGLQRLTTHPAVDDQPAWSPDGMLITFRSLRDGYSDVWLMRAHGGQQQNLTADNIFRDVVVNEHPTFDAGGSRIVFARTITMFTPAQSALVSIRPDGSDPRPLTSLRQALDREPAFSADGRRLAIRRSLPGSPDQLTLLDPATGQPLFLFVPPGPGFTPVWSHDGSWLAFSASDHGQEGIYITRPNEQIRRMIAPVGRNPAWIRR